MRSAASGVIIGAALGAVVAFAQSLSLSVSAPTTASGTVSLSASASATGLSSVRWTVDGQPVGSEITAGACVTSWDSRTVANGAHVVHAVGRTASGVPVSSAPMTVTVSNTAVPPPPPPPPPQGTTLPAGAVQCAIEGGSCTWAGGETRTVYYGANGAFVSRALASPVACDNATFGDPIVGVFKACHMGPTAPPPPPPVDPCVAQPGVLTVSSWPTAAEGSRQLRYSYTVAGVVTTVREARLSFAPSRALTVTDARGCSVVSQ